MFDEINNSIGYELILALGSFLLAMFITPTYTNFAYKHKLWKKQKSVAITGEELKYMNKAHEEKIKRHFPTMAGIIMLIAVTVVTVVCCLNRGQTWLPLAGLANLNVSSK